MEFKAVLAARRSVRQFASEAVPEAVIRRALEDALLAPNSSNMQPWEFYWVRTPSSKAKLVEACFSQAAARTAAELVVAVARTDTWRRNRALLLEKLASEGPVPAYLTNYYRKVVPAAYWQDPFGLAGLLKRIFFGVVGLWRPVPRGPSTRAELVEVVTKTTALACENFMLSVVDQGYASCPMEGFDEKRVKRLLGLGRASRVVMVFGVGRAAKAPAPSTHVRLASELFLHEV